MEFIEKPLPMQVWNILESCTISKLCHLLNKAVLKARALFTDLFGEANYHRNFTKFFKLLQTSREALKSLIIYFKVGV